ncbi:MAG: (Fe-S)-binding protein [Archaeoglobus sp.]|nr:(Fe-S)-binding protein [Archaeoglobus sp.]
MSEANFLKNLSDEIYACAQCNYCRVCPTYKIEKWESVSPRGRLYLLKLMLNGSKIDSVMLKDFFKCTTCGLCENICIVDIPLLELWEKARNWLTKVKGPLPAHKKLADNIGIHMNIYGEDRNLRDAWFPDNVEISDSETLFFAGCTASYRVREIAESAVKIFSRFGIEFNYLGRDEVCCGSTLIRTGQKEKAERLVEKNIKIWERNGIERVITTCAGCYRTFALDYPRICEERGIDFNFEILHLSQFIEREAGKVIKDGMKAKLKGRATYHDPCHLGRHAGVYDEPRELIKASGLELVEMEHSRENSFCCGAGGGVRAQFRDLSLEIGKLRLEEALQLNVDYLISCCPFCKMHLSHSKKVSGLERNDKPEILDISEVVLKVLNENGF